MVRLVCIHPKFPLFFQGAKRPQVSKYSKLKKKLGWGTSEENLNMADESMSRETKRSKKGGGVESKRHKWRTPKEKSVNFADSSEFDTVGEFPDSVDVHVPQSRERDYINTAPAGSVTVSGSSGKSYNSIISAHVTGSDDVFGPSSSGYDVTVYEGPRTPRVPPKSYIGRVPDYVNVGSVRKDDCFSSIMVQDPVIMVSIRYIYKYLRSTERTKVFTTVHMACSSSQLPMHIFWAITCTWYSVRSAHRA